MNRVLHLWQKLADKPFGKALFSRLVCWKAPYFATIKPRFEAIQPGFVMASMPKRRAVHNHIGTVHAIAVCNLAELVAGTLMEVSLSARMRWLPRGMTVSYLKKATTHLIAEARASDLGDGPARDVVVSVEVKDAAGQVVTRAEITMYISPRPAVY